MNPDTTLVLPISKRLLPGAEARIPVDDLGLRARAVEAGRALLLFAGDELAVEAEIKESDDAGVVARVTGRRTVDGQPVVEHGFGADADKLVLALRVAGGAVLSNIEAPDAGQFADLAAAALDLGDAERAKILFELDVVARLRVVGEALKRRTDADRAVRRVEILKTKKREILEQLGEDAAAGDISDELREKIAKAGMPPEVEAVAKKQAARLGTVGDNSPEFGVTQSYLDWLLDLPWSRRSADRDDVVAARASLEADHHGLSKIKKRVLEFLAVRKLAPSKKGPILCFYGPPGVGKTSLGRSIAKALGREFVRISLGGVRDEAEIRGHRRTYVGALPGRIIQAMRKVGVRNPVVMLDEIDKLSSDFGGDPAAALLEVLDPEQNGTFSDHYLEVPFDLSEVVFIATANQLDTIAAPLLDRMEVLTLPGYSPSEKREIAQKHLIPKQLAEHGLATDSVAFLPETLDELITAYTREAGVRSLEREIANVLRGVAVQVASRPASTVSAPVELHPADLTDALGPRRHLHEVAESALDPGVATGMAWTPSGGEILFVEATRMRGRGQLALTGQLGDVMRESATAAFSWVRANAPRLGLGALDGSDVHVHVPAGGVPKDGPSAGVALVASLVSLLSGRPVRGDVAMTGEITLRGRVLPVGGVAAKVLAAHRAGVRTVLLPERNVRDLDELPAEVRASLEVVPLKHVDEMLERVLLQAPQIGGRLLVPPPTPDFAVAA